MFDECTDIVDADLVLVMDAFDYAALLREVSVFDTIHPTGRYSQRVKHIAGFVPMAPTALRPVSSDAPSAVQAPTANAWTALAAKGQPQCDDEHAAQACAVAHHDAVLHPADIPDPLYGDGRVDNAALRGMVQALRRACRGVLAFLERASLHADDVPTLSAAIASGVAATDAAPLACTLRRGAAGACAAEQGSVQRHPVKWRPLWLDDADLVIEQQRLLRTQPHVGGGRGGQGQAHHDDKNGQRGMRAAAAKQQALYTLGNGVIVPLHGVSRRRGYWCDLTNVLYELVGWMRAYSYGTGYMPASTELKETGAHQLANAIMHHGGTHEVCMHVLLLVVCCDGASTQHCMQSHRAFDCVMHG